MKKNRVINSLGGMLYSLGFDFEELEDLKGQKLLFTITAISREDVYPKLSDDGNTYGITDWRIKDKSIMTSKVDWQNMQLVIRAVNKLTGVIQHDTACGCEGCHDSFFRRIRKYREAIACLLDGDGGCKLEELSRDVMSGLF